MGEVNLDLSLRVRLPGVSATEPLAILLTAAGDFAPLTLVRRQRYHRSSPPWLLVRVACWRCRERPRSRPLRRPLPIFAMPRPSSLAPVSGARSLRASLDGEQERRTNSRSYPFIISERGAPDMGCANGRAVQAGQVRAEQLPILVASATADTFLATARQSPATVHAGQPPLRHGATAEPSSARWSAAGLHARGMRMAPWFRRMRHSLWPCNPPRCTARANPCLSQPCEGPTAR